jgi:hypothetical protein
VTDREIFLAVFDLPDPAARTRYLDEACGGDPAQRARVEALLLSHDTAGTFLGSPAVTPPGPDLLATLELGDVVTPNDDANEADGDLEFLAAPRRPDSLGRIGHYEVLEVLGRGGFGIVFRAFDETLQRVVAIKVLTARIAATSPARKRFLREARSSAKVRHENVVQVYAVEEQPLPYLVMEFIPGETLQQWLDRTGPLETVEVLRLGRQIAEGLAAAHAMDLIHRDIKPANILIEAGPQQRVKITDFGLARAADDASLTQSGLIAGTPLFMAPEQARGDTLDHRADLFSLGSVLYTMCSGRPPFRANNTLAVLKRVAEDTPRPIPEIIPEVPQWLCDVIARLHAKKPEDRMGTASEVADLLARGLAEMQRPGMVPSLADVSPTAVLKVPREGEAPAEPGESRKPAAPMRSRFRIGRWGAAAAVLLTLLGALGFTEATGVTNFRGTVIRLFAPEGTLVVEVDDPGVSIKIDGSDMVITGAGVKEIRLKPGRYTVEASKDGKLVRRELIAVTKNGRQVVRVSQEALSSEAKAAAASTWERSVAAMPAAAQVKAVVARLQELNPGFDGQVKPTIENGVVTGLRFLTPDVSNIAPVRALQGLSSLECAFTKVSDLSPLKGMKLHRLQAIGIPASDLTPLQGMPLTSLDLYQARGVTNLQPLQGMPLEYLNLTGLPVSDLSALKGMTSLRFLVLENMPLSDLTPLRALKLNTLKIKGTQVSDLAVLKAFPLTHLALDYRADREAFLRSLKGLEHINDKPAAQFWREVNGK